MHAVSDEAKPVEGSCLCGAVRFALEPPYRSFQYCHCSRCRKATGSRHAANIFVKAPQLRWTAGEQLVRRYEHGPARYFCTTFCATCGSALPWHSRNGKLVIVPAGALDSDPGVRPARNVHHASRAPWAVACEELPVFDDEPAR